MVALEDRLNRRTVPESARWRQEWFVGIGVLVLFLGAFAGADLFASTLASVFYVGVLMSAAAALELAHAQQQWNSSVFGYWLSAAIAYAAVAGLSMANPTLSAWALTVLLGAALTMSGLARFLLSLRLRSNYGWVWLAVSGAISLLVGLTFLLESPGSAVWTFGAILSFDLAFQGCALISLGLAFAV